MSNASGNVADRTNSGELLHLVADGLTANDFDVRLPTYEGGSRLTIKRMDAWCTLSVSDMGYVEWECPPSSTGEPDPKCAADLATMLLTGSTGDMPYGGNAYEALGVTFKGVVAMELKSRGLDVALNVFKDEKYFEAVSEIVVTNPDSRDDATVRVTDDGHVTWACDYSTEATTVAGVVVATISQAMAQLEWAERHARAGAPR